MQIDNEDNGWFERGELPPVGAMVKINIKPCASKYVEKMHGMEAEILMHRTSSTGHAVAVFCIIDDDGFNSYHALTADDNFRPIKSERERVIDMLVEILREANSSPYGEGENVFLRIAKALEKATLKLPKSDR